MSTKIVFKAYMFDGENHGQPDHFIDMLLVDSETRLENGARCDQQTCEIECFGDWGNTIPVAGIACFSKLGATGSFLMADRATLVKRDNQAVLTMRFDAQGKVWIFNYMGKITKVPHVAGAPKLTLVFE